MKTGLDLTKTCQIKTKVILPSLPCALHKDITLPLHLILLPLSKILKETLRVIQMHAWISKRNIQSEVVRLFLATEFMALKFNGLSKLYSGLILNSFLWTDVCNNTCLCEYL